MNDFFDSRLRCLANGATTVESIRNWLADELERLEGVDTSTAIKRADAYLVRLINAEAARLYVRSIP